MKKFLLLFGMLMCLSVNIDAQNIKFYTTDFAFTLKDNDGDWSDWSDWIDCRCLVNINLDRNEINIYSDEPQELTIYDWEEDTYEDPSGGTQLTMYCVDAEGLRCSARLRLINGIMQLYVDYSNMKYVYNLKEK